MTSSWVAVVSGGSTAQHQHNAGQIERT
ncbi:hypothetical protein CGCFRS4_v016150 [Colletotrichum fructicola]|nr:hypothetical protein CGCFRS4_v016150 [Colletotrichum fructicola]